MNEIDETSSRTHTSGSSPSDAGKKEESSSDTKAFTTGYSASISHGETTCDGPSASGKTNWRGRTVGHSVNHSVTRKTEEPEANELSFQAAIHVASLSG